MGLAEKIDLLCSLAGTHSILLSNKAGRANTVPGDGTGVREATAAWHVEYGYMTSDTARWVELGIGGEGDTPELAVDDCLRRWASRLAARVESQRAYARKTLEEADAAVQVYVQINKVMGET